MTFPDGRLKGLQQVLEKHGFKVKNLKATVAQKTIPMFGHFV